MSVPGSVVPVVVPALVMIIAEPPPAPPGAVAVNSFHEKVMLSALPEMDTGASVNVQWVTVTSVAPLMLRAPVVKSTPRMMMSFAPGGMVRAPASVALASAPVRVLPLVMVAPPTRARFIAPVMVMVAVPGASSSFLSCWAAAVAGSAATVRVAGLLVVAVTVLVAMLR